MSRSRKKTPITGMSMADSDKQDKKIANRMFRRVTRKRLREDEDPILPEREELYGDANFAKDGRQWISVTKHPKLMRK